MIAFLLKFFKFNQQILLLALTFSLFLKSQEITIKGIITNNENRGIQSASVSLLDKNDEFLGYSFSDRNGFYSITFSKPKDENIKISLSCLGYHKVSKIINTSNQTQNFILDEKVELIKEIVINSKKIIINQDTTKIKLASFSNKTEQTVEDILKKLPGIEITKDGTIKVHGKTIDKLLIEGDDMFDKNYKILSKNLDAKVLNEVQIIDNYEDNPMFKKLNISDKVALNLKLKKEIKSVWFGNITLGSSFFPETRWKETINLGLIKRKIKFFYFGDYNNIGEKSTDIISSNIIDKSNFSNDRYEYRAKSLFSIINNEIPLFSKAQSVFNSALFNSISFNSKLKKNMSIRGVMYFANDKQNQNSSTITKFNLENNPTSFTEDNNFSNIKTLASAELELKYLINDKNYITNLFILKNNPNKTVNNLLFNSVLINQNSNTNNYTIYNHFNHTIRVSENRILNNYFYFGNDKINEKADVISPFLNNFLNINTNDIIYQNSKNKLLYIGNKSKLISKSKKLDYTNTIQLEYSKELFSNTFIANYKNILDYENNNSLKLIQLFQENTFRYNFSKNIDLTTVINFQNTQSNSFNFSENIFLLKPSIFFNIKKTKFGSFSLSYSENKTLPDINQLTSNFQLTDYHSFSKGVVYQKPLKNQTTMLNYSFYNDEKRYSINTSLSYSRSKTILNTLSTLTPDFNFNSLSLTKGGENYNFYLSFVNYIKKLKLVSKIETTNNWTLLPINVNSDRLSSSKSFINSIKYSGTTYFKSKINFDFGFSYNYSQSNFQNIKTNYNTKECFISINYNISKTILLESINSLYILNNQAYSYNNVILSYNPKESRFSYRLTINNLNNEKQYKYITISNYSYYKSIVQLVPRYTLASIKYRF